MGVTVEELLRTIDRCGVGSPRRDALRALGDGPAQIEALWRALALATRDRPLDRDGALYAAWEVALAAHPQAPGALERALDLTQCAAGSGGEVAAPLPAIFGAAFPPRWGGWWAAASGAGAGTRWPPWRAGAHPRRCARWRGPAATATPPRSAAAAGSSSSSWRPGGG